MNTIAQRRACTNCKLQKSFPTVKDTQDTSIPPLSNGRKSSAKSCGFRSCSVQTAQKDHTNPNDVCKQHIQRCQCTHIENGIANTGKKALSQTKPCTRIRGHHNTKTPCRAKDCLCTPPPQRRVPPHLPPLRREKLTVLVYSPCCGVAVTVRAYW